jgi:putative tryptophan/tyrosine transport system substrate-binding protein
MRRRDFITLVGGTASWSLAAQAQQPAPPVVGFLSLYHPSNARPLLEAFRKGLAEAGFVEGRNIAVEYRWAEDHYERLPALAADLVRHQVAVLVASGGEASALAAKSATATIPIVFSSNADPVQAGLVASLNRPGGNLTGVSLLTTAEMLGKRLGLLRMLLPKAAVLGLLVHARSINVESETRAARSAAQAIGQHIIVERVGTDDDLERAYRQLAQPQIEGLLVQSDPLFFSLRNQLVALAAHYSLPAIFGRREYVTAGGLISYGSDIADGYRQQGVYAGRILKGEKPADLPVVQPTKFDLVVNLNTAKALSIDVPAQLLALTDEVVE